MLDVSGGGYDFDIPTLCVGVFRGIAFEREMSHAPAVKLVPASVAVLKNSSKSRSCVIDWRRVES